MAIDIANIKQIMYSKESVTSVWHPASLLLP